MANYDVGKDKPFKDMGDLFTKEGKKLKENDKVTVYNDDGSIKIKYSTKVKIKIKDPDFIYLGDDIIEFIEDKS